MAEDCELLDVGYYFKFKMNRKWMEKKLRNLSKEELIIRIHKENIH